MTRVLPLLWLLGALLVPSLAAADSVEPTTFSGRIVRAVHLETPRGVAAAQLAYLVEQPVDEPLNPQAVRRSVELLFRLGQFDDVRADVTPLPDGSVELTFTLSPSPRIGRLALRGVTRLPQSAVLASLERGRGDPYVPGDEARLALQVERFYRSRGFLDVIATGRLANTPSGNRAIRIDVEEGRRYTIGEVRFVGEQRGYPDRRLLSLLGSKVQPGVVYREEALKTGLERMIAQLKKLGFVEARLLSLPGPRRRSRVPVEVRKDSEAGRVDLIIPLDAGHLVEAEFLIDGGRRWSQRRLEQVVGLTSAARVSRTYAEDAARQLERFLWRQGFYHAEVEVAVVDETFEVPEAPEWALPLTRTMRVLRFKATTGPPVRLSAKDITTQGNEFASRRKTISILSDGSPEVLGHRPLMFVVLGFDIYERYFTDGELDQTIDVLEDWYRARGFLSATITPSVRLVSRSCKEEEEIEGGKRVCLQLSFDEGTRTEVESLAVDAGGADLDPGAIKGWEGRFVGAPFNPAALEALVAEVQDALAERGFIDAKVTSTQELSDDATLVRLGVEVLPGQPVRFGQVVVRESRHTQVGFIRRQIVVRPGELYSRKALQTAQGRLLRTGLFDGVVLRPAQSTGRLRDIELLINERKRFSFVFGAGLTWPDDGPRVSGEARLRNLDGRGLSLWTRGRASIDWRSITLGVLLPEYRASLGMELPYLPGLPVRAAVTGLINEELDEPTYRISRSGVKLGVDWRPSNRLTVNGEVQFQLRAPIRVDSVARLNSLTDIPKDRPRQNPSVLALAALSAVVDFRDDRFNPTKGVYLAATVDTTPGAVIAGAPGFGRLVSRVVGLIPLAPGGFGLQLEGAGGVAWTYDGQLPPVEWRFRLGGTSTVRGFRLDSIGPTGRRAGTLESAGLITAGQEREVPVGGNAFYRYSVQLQLPIPGLKGWRLTIFHDAGNALIYGAVPDGIDAGRTPVLYPSVGIGLRRLTPIGPLRLELAVRPDRLGRLGQVFEGNEALADVLQVHFAVGAL
ncbi:MAG: BamA/TamA family outer membrane protein [Deltaproteobacteria bacterium]|nr:BamA/TamA family outer membrane protein [Deltaproteobacteria bacterium]